MLLAPLPSVVPVVGTVESCTRVTIFRVRYFPLISFRSSHHAHHRTVTLPNRWPLLQPHQLMIEEQDARKVDILGVPFNLVIPDGGAGGGTSSTANGQSEAGVGTGLSSDSGSLGTRDRSRTQQAQNDLRDGRAREEDMTPAATLKVAALWLVLISQLWLLLVFWNDPMGPASSAFLRD